MSFFEAAKLCPRIEAYELMKQFEEDDFPQKVDCGVGVYRNNEGKSWLLPVVKAAQNALNNDPSLTKDYLGAFGLESFTSQVTRMLLGTESKALAEDKAFGIQSISGSGSLRVGAEYLAKTLRRTICYFSQPTWNTHNLIFLNAGFEETREFRYWHAEKRDIDMEGLLEDLNNAPEGSVVVLHACCHNPTGCDPSQDQWSQIAKVIRKRKLLTFFDCAYQGFATGDLDRDAWAVRYFVEEGLELLCAQSFSKNFGLYNERIGNLTIVLNNPTYVAAVQSEIQWIIRGMYLNPTANGARIVAYVLNNTDLYEEWKDNVKTMSSRIREMRKRLREELEALGTPGDWSHITHQVGMFSYTGLNEAQSLNMLNKYHVYMFKTGRISITGLTTANVQYVAKCIYETVTQV